MESLAPTDDVRRCGWFKAERENGMPTRWQRAVYAIQGGLDDYFVVEKLKVDIAPLRRQLLDAIDNLSAQVHARENTIVSDTETQNAFARDTLDAVQAFLLAHHECRAAIVSPIQEELDEAALDTLISETIPEVDELASHHSVVDAHIYQTSVTGIGPYCLTYRAKGTVRVTLQWGSNSDLRKGDGAELGLSFPFQCDISVSVDNPWDLSLADTNFGVDTSSWRDGMNPDLE